MTDICPYPWQQNQWQSFIQQKASGQLAHAFMLAGQRGTGKWHFALSMAHYLLCQSPRSDLPCGQCKSCHMLKSGNHPDLSQVSPESRHKGIKIDQIRDLTQFLAKTAQQQGYKVAVLGPVEQLNVNAGNALLKSLEEPAGQTVLILTSNVTDNVMATIKSRCQLMAMPRPSREFSIDWFDQLKQNKGGEALLDISALSPLLAAELLEEERFEQLEAFLKSLASMRINPESIDLGLIKPWLNAELMDLLDWWIQLVNLILHRGSKAANAQNYRYNDDKSGISGAMESVLSAAEMLDPQSLYMFLDKLLLLKRQQINGANPNKQLLLEDLTITWRHLNHRSTPAVSVSNL